MNDNAKKWVQALRSKLYEQGQGQLKDGDGFCCLGVSCALYMKEKGGKWEIGKDGNYLFINECYVLPKDVRDWLSLKSDSGSYYIQEVKTLTGLNDGGRTFDEIADIIESEPEGLFRE